jgi:signal transduction histidine kinase/ActR/RegA family two-component response regulator
MRSPRASGNSSTAAAAGSAHASAPGGLHASFAGRPLAADLLSLRELQASLALEENDDAVVRVGTNAIVEILAVDCGLALVDGAEGRPPIRFGWLQGRAMATGEMDSLAEALKGDIAAAREGRTGTQLLVAAPHAVPGTPTLAAQVRALGFSSVLVLPLPSGGRSCGVLVLAARDPEGFAGEQAILAEILAGQMSDQCGRARATAGAVVATAPQPRLTLVGSAASRAATTTSSVVGAGAAAPGTTSAGGGTTSAGRTAEAGRLEARVAALEAQLAVAGSVSLSHDADRQIATALRKAIELTGHTAGAIYLVETNDACDDILRLVHGEGDPAWLEIARLPRWRQGEGLPGRVWAAGEGMSFANLDDDPAGIGRDVLRKAGYGRMCCEPLRVRGRTTGVLELFAGRAGAYGGDERDLVRAIAQQVAVAIQNARLVADLMRNGLDLEWQVERLGAESRRALEERLGLEEALAAAAAEPYAESRAAAVLDRILDASGGDLACVHETDTTDGGFRMLSQRGLPSDVIDALYHRPASDPVLKAMPPGSGIAVVDVASETAAAADWPRRLGVRHLALVPCRSGSEVRGVLMLGSRYFGAFSESVRDALTATAALLALVIEGAGTARARDIDATSDVSGAEDGNLAGAPVPQDASPGAARAESRPRPSALAHDSASPAAEDAREAHAAGRAAAAPGPAPDPRLLVQAQKAAAIAALATGFERDFNNTMGTIMGHASHIRALVPDHNPVHDKAATIEEHSYRAADLVKRLLLFARGGSGRRERLDLNTLVEETVALLGRTFDPAIVLESRCSADLPPVEVDPGAIRQVLLNLAINAREALPDGGRIVFETRSGHLEAGAVKGLPDLAAGDYISVVVGDNGLGMAAEVLEHAFEPFFGTRPVTQSCGLGLTVAHEIVRDHGGHIALSSAPGIGTAARLYIPVAPGAAGVARTAFGRGATRADSPETGAGAAAAATPPMEIAGEMTTTSGGPAGPDGTAEKPVPGITTLAPAPGAPGKSGKLPQTLPWLTTCPVTGEASGRILLVDDETVLRDMMAEMLKARGYEVVAAGDGVEALEIYRQEWGRIDLVIVDLVMPRLGGLETFRRISGMNRKARVLLCTGSTHHHQAQQALAEGAVGLLPKPFGMGELVGWVEKALEKKEGAP